ncbi:hypothetical protein [Actinospongicola halichondriae]|uniref:hypothetical protein n=1 Tax=Actinospongicola halichondriae TaxID=3236844 RepID=UPI003D39305D
MRPVAIVAYISTMTTRRDVRAQTIESLLSTDWTTPPVAVIDQGRFAVGGSNSTDNAREVLERASAADGWDLLLFLEDDVDFNQHLLHNLENWPPIVDLEPGDHFCASLYDPDIGSLDPTQDGETYRIVDPLLTYGSQAILLSRPTLDWILDNFRAHIGLSDIRIFHLAARKTPIFYHRPSLVQHRAVPSMWGGVAHQAKNYDPTFRAVEIP